MIDTKKLLENRNALVILAGLLAAVILMAVVALFVGGFKPPKSPASTPLTPEETFAETPEEINKVSREAVDNQDPSLCEKIKSEAVRKGCRDNALTAKAVGNADVKICGEINDTASQAVCKDSVIINRAVLTQDPGLCENLSDSTKISQCQKNAAPSR